MNAWSENSRLKEVSGNAFCLGIIAAIRHYAVKHFHGFAERSSMLNVYSSRFDKDFSNGVVLSCSNFVFFYFKCGTL